MVAEYKKRDDSSKDFAGGAGAVAPDRFRGNARAVGTEASKHTLVPL